MTWFLLFIPAAIGLEVFVPERHFLVFAASSLAILPLAAWMGRATEELAGRLGEGAGGLLNATFGNAAELIIALVALHAGLYDIVKASIAGAIVGNILLVLGAAMLAGGLRHPRQNFNPDGARSHATMLTLAAIALVLPATLRLADASAGQAINHLSVAISVLLILVYAAYLVFSLVTHSELFVGPHLPEEQMGHASIARSVSLLAATTAGIAWMSEIMVGAIEPMAREFGLSQVFIGVFVVAIVGNAAEHTTAITVALKDRMDLAISIAIGSSVQIALFVAPVLVMASHLVGPAPMDLALSPDLVLIVFLSVLITGQITGDGRSDWLEGVQLLVVYLVLACTFFFLPIAPPH
jgi:Ca2+:H+ antiporter